MTNDEAVGGLKVLINMSQRRLAKLRHPWEKWKVRICLMLILLGVQGWILGACPSIPVWVTAVIGGGLFTLLDIWHVCFLRKIEKGYEQDIKGMEATIQNLKEAS